ncbi:hypothetical protein ZWY2020_055690 [Hordeum vulgare]|nr:hypothetical protein ZWY2020_055690 [Hordeum vulgare]
MGTTVNSKPSVLHAPAPASTSSFLRDAGRSTGAEQGGAGKADHRLGRSSTISSSCLPSSSYPPPPPPPPTRQRPARAHHDHHRRSPFCTANTHFHPVPAAAPSMHQYHLHADSQSLLSALDVDPMLVDAQATNAESEARPTPLLPPQGAAASPPPTLILSVLDLAEAMQQLQEEEPTSTTTTTMLVPHHSGGNGAKRS